MTRRISDALERLRGFLEGERRNDGTWGPNGDEVFRVTPTSLASSVLRNDARTNLASCWIFLERVLRDAPPMTRLFAWPLWADDSNEFPSSLRDLAVAKLLELQCRSGAWPHAASQYADSLGANGSERASLLPTFLAVVGLVPQLRSDNPAVRSALERTVGWVTALPQSVDGSVVVSHERTPVCSTAFALAIATLSESHNVDDDWRRRCVAFLVEAIDKGAATTIETIDRAGRYLDTSYRLTTPLWVLFALAPFVTQRYEPSVLWLLRYVLDLQSPNGGMARTPKGLDRDVYVAAQFGVVIGHMQSQLSSQSFADAVIATSERRTPSPHAVSTPRDAVIMHISDIHCGCNPKDSDGGYEATLQSLVRDVEEQYPELEIPTPNIVILSGDVTYRGRPEGYAQASEFLRDLARHLNIRDVENRVIVVPGNHDVNRPLSRFAFGINPFSEESGGVKGPLYDYRFVPFKEFFDAFYRLRRFALDANAMYWIYDLSEAFRLIVIAFNSAAGTDHTASGQMRGCIPLGTIQRAIQEAAKLPNWLTSAKIAVWHHALLTEDHNDPSYDDEVVGRLERAGIDAVLHGHIHRPLSSLREVDERSGRATMKLGAGSVSVQATERPPEWPRHYQVIRIDAESKTGRVWARQLIGREWKAAAIYRKGLSWKDFKVRS